MLMDPPSADAGGQVWSWGWGSVLNLPQPFHPLSKLATGCHPCSSESPSCRCSDVAGPAMGG